MSEQQTTESDASNRVRDTCSGCGHEKGNFWRCAKSPSCGCSKSHYSTEGDER